jgi:hypothetical protein
VAGGLDHALRDDPGRDDLPLGVDVQDIPVQRPRPLRQGAFERVPLLRGDDARDGVNFEGDGALAFPEGRAELARAAPGRLAGGAGALGDRVEDALVLRAGQPVRGQGLVEMAVGVVELLAGTHVGMRFPFSRGL